MKTVVNYLIYFIFFLVGVVSAKEINEIENGSLDFSANSILNPIHLSKNTKERSVLIKLKYKASSVYKGHVESTCSCAEVVDSVFQENGAEIVINYVGTILDGVQNFSIIIRDEGQIKQLEQKVSVFTGGAKCMLERNVFTRTELSKGEGIIISLRLFQDEDGKPPRVSLEGVEDSLKIESLSNTNGLSWYNVWVDLKEPNVGIYWINVTCGACVYKLPIIIKS